MTHRNTNRKKNREIVRLKDPELEKHKQQFLGNPGSKKYRDFVRELKAAKQRIHGLSKPGATRRRVEGGGPGRIRLFTKAEEYRMNNLLAFANSPKWFTDTDIPSDDNDPDAPITAKGEKKSEQIQLYPELTETITPDHIRYKWDKGELDISENGVLNESEIYRILFPFFMKVYTQLIEQLGKLNDNSTRTYAMIKDNLIFVIELLREINLYASPIWFDDLFYYFYYLNLDKIFKNISGVLGNLMKSRDAPPIAETGADFYMDVYPSRENDTDIDNQKENRYVSYLRMKERNPGPENIRHLNHWLNLIYYGPFTPKTHTKKVSLLMAKAKELLKSK